MNWSTPRSWLLRLTRLALAGLVGSVVGGGAESRAGAVSASDARPQLAGRVTAEHQCPCGANCQGDSCCCSPRRAVKPTQPVAARPLAPARVETGASKARRGPCLGAAPCGESGIPTTPASTPIDRVAFWGRDWVCFPAVVARFARVQSSTAAPDRRVDRLDDPPELAAG